MAIDWRERDAANQATIARAGIGGRDAVQPPAPGDPLRNLPAAAPRARALSRLRPSGRHALIHVPLSLDPAAPAPLVCMLHGCTQDAATFAAATVMNELADRQGFVVAYPGQDRGENQQGCWNWFRPEHQRRGAGEPATIAGIVGELIEVDTRCTIDRGRVYVAGLSAGGAMAAILAACYPDLFAAVAVHSGLAYNSATDVNSAFQVMARGGGNADSHGRAAHAAMGEHRRPVPSIVIHGTADRTVAPANAIDVLRQSMISNHLAAPEICDHDVAHPTDTSRTQLKGERPYTRSRWIDRREKLMHELLEIEGLGHAWSGGAAGGSYTDPRGPSSTEAIWSFFAQVTAVRASG